MSRRPEVGSDATSIVLRIGSASVRVSPDEADAFADRVKAEAAALRKAIAEAPKRKARTMDELRGSVAVRRPRGS